MTKSGKLIRTTRVKLNIPQKDIAEKIGCTPQYIWNIENGKALPPKTFVWELCKLLKINKTKMVNLILKDIKDKFYTEA